MVYLLYKIYQRKLFNLLNLISVCISCLEMWLSSFLVDVSVQQMLPVSGNLFLKHITYTIIISLILDINVCLYFYKSNQFNHALRQEYILKSWFCDLRQVNSQSPFKSMIIGKLASAFQFIFLNVKTKKHVRYCSEKLS